MEAYEPDGFKTLTLRVDKQTRTAVPEGLLSLFLYDSLTVVVTGVHGVDPDDVVFGVFSASGDILSADDGWAFVPGRKDAIYSAVTLSTANAETLAATLTPDEPATVWLSMAETGGKTLMSTSMPFYRSLIVTGGGSAGEISSYVTSAAIAALASNVAAMPSNTDYDRKRKFDALVAGLQALST